MEVVLTCGFDCVAPGCGCEQQRGRTVRPPRQTTAATSLCNHESPQGQRSQPADRVAPELSRSARSALHGCSADGTVWSMVNLSGGSYAPWLNGLTLWRGVLGDHLSPCAQARWEEAERPVERPAVAIAACRGGVRQGRVLTGWPARDSYVWRSDWRIRPAFGKESSSLLKLGGLPSAGGGTFSSSANLASSSDAGTKKSASRPSLRTGA